MSGRRLRGTLGYLSGHAAEELVAGHYAAAGAVILARRWRGRAGEIDLVVREDARIVFVEVKRAENHATAAERLGPVQMARIRGAALEFVAQEPAGQDCEMRFDVALVDGAGRLEIRAADLPD
jgi:putative endonuclease